MNHTLIAVLSGFSSRQRKHRLLLEWPVKRHSRPFVLFSHQVPIASHHVLKNPHALNIQCNSITKMTLAADKNSWYLVNKTQRFNWLMSQKGHSAARQYVIYLVMTWLIFLRHIVHQFLFAFTDRNNFGDEAFWLIYCF